MWRIINYNGLYVLMGKRALKSTRADIRGRACVLGWSRTLKDGTNGRTSLWCWDPGLIRDGVPVVHKMVEMFAKVLLCEITDNLLQGR